jgi:hypothetical protein
MTRAWLLLAPAVVGACAVPLGASGPWVVQPESAGPCAPGETTAGSCFPIGNGQELLVPPVVVGPGRIAVVTRLGLRGVAGPGAPGGDQPIFVIEEISRAGEQRLAAGICPGRDPAQSRLVGLVRLPSGETGLVCLENGNREGCFPNLRPCDPYSDEEGVTQWDCQPIRSCHAGFVHFGVIDRANMSIAWRWRMEIEFGLDAQDIHFAAVGDRLALIYLHFDNQPPHFNGWRVVFGPDKTQPPLPGVLRLDETLVAAFASGGALKLIFKRAGPRLLYRELTIAKGGASALVDLDPRNRVTPGELRDPCLAEDEKGKLTVTLPDPDEWQDPDRPPPPAQRRLTLRYPKALTPQGPDVFPATRALCPPQIEAPSVAWTRASFDAVGPIIVYTLGGPAYPHSLRVERRVSQ